LWRAYLILWDITSTRVSRELSKAVEWLVMVVQGAKNIYKQFNPNDLIAMEKLAALDYTPAQLGSN
jgi:hypothetical protein